MKIKQVHEPEVLRLLVEGNEVFRFRPDMNVVVHLTNISISDIKNKLTENKYVYFILIDEE